MPNRKYMLGDQLARPGARRKTTLQPDARTEARRSCGAERACERMARAQNNGVFLQRAPWMQVLFRERRSAAFDSYQQCFQLLGR
jgi:hypothetical protein